MLKDFKQNGKSKKSPALLTEDKYVEWYQESIENPDRFWGKQGKSIDWFKPYTKVKNTSFSGKVSIKWFEDGVTNASYNCIDRHLAKHANKTALIWESDNPYINKKITYKELHENVCRLANVLKKQGVKKGDFVTIYMSMIPEAVYAMLACARIGAVHSLVFSGFSPDALAGRLVGCRSTFVITCDEGVRGGKTIPLKGNTDIAVRIAAKQYVFVKKVLVVRRTGNKINWAPSRDLWYHQETASVRATCAPARMKAEDPLFILYTSGSTGKPKGIVHTTGGYLVYASLTHRYVFDYNDRDVFWSTADLGWITGHTYLVYGPLTNGATVVMFEGVPNYPDYSRAWEIIDKYRVSVFYTAPTLIRSMMGAGDQFVKKASLTSLRLLGSVGEPINPEAWDWYNRMVGKNKLPIVDTWWQTETGGIMITALPSSTGRKAEFTNRPFFGIQTQLVDSDGKVIEGEGSGNLCIVDSWPAQARTVLDDHNRFIEGYFSTYKEKYFTGDGCRRNAEGCYQITGRVDDVINVSGHRLGSAEVESALVSHPLVSEAAVVGFPHPIKSQGVYCYVTLMEGYEGSEELRQELINHVRSEIGPVATPDMVQFVPALPKTRSGKILRRILRKIAEKDTTGFGDLSTVENPHVIEQIIRDRTLL
ncbi:MAG TPA: acetate--CoA ligase [Candidatus Avacidaminococcus intestinavium]|uniref:Acetate--CoA ligase n=1 Tax=Candidatus Avacidaminococcus intestinavium TaxID=2840684 RepID=A0A9D1SL73_9FIRM|nr:acetate--CoA ligase [Candidatus Avacidaminococcus intestinavium]